MKFETIIGLEIHLQLKTKSKFFCSCSTKEEAEPNKNICPICMGQPGVLPALNKKALKFSLMLGLALEGEINKETNFDRKNYFYPDLPKGYQISQYELPIIKSGVLEVNNKKINLERIHLEEDTAKTFHNKGELLLDFNRAGIPLVEIVTKPEITTPKLAKNFLKELQMVVRYLNISDANMEKSQMRCDANISLRPKNSSKFFPKTEIKNLNSFKSVERALNFEIQRQKRLWQKKEPPKKEVTKGWDQDKQVTVIQRTKEAVSDYRYFPEPDLPPFNIKDLDLDLKAIRADLPELPSDKRRRFISEYSIRPSDAAVLVKNKKLAHYIEKVISELKAWLVSLETVEGTEKQVWQKYKSKLSKLVSNWLINHLLTDEMEFNITPENFAEFIIFIYEKKTPNVLAAKILKIMDSTGQDIDNVLAEHDLQSSKKGTLKKWIQEILEKNPKIIEKYKNGNTNVLKFLIGQVMKKAQGKADPETIEEILKDKLD